MANTPRAPTILHKNVRDEATAGSWFGVRGSGLGARGRSGAKRSSSSNSKQCYCYVFVPANNERSRSFGSVQFSSASVQLPSRIPEALSRELRGRFVFARMCVTKHVCLHQCLVHLVLSARVRARARVHTRVPVLVFVHAPMFTLSSSPHIDAFLF